MNKRYYYIISNDSFWSCSDALFVSGDELPGDADIVKLSNINELKICLDFYKYPMGEFASLEYKLDLIDKEISDSILAGFNYALEKRGILHFNYDSMDQQNFSDAINIVTLMKLGLPGLPETVSWNAYDEDCNLIVLNLTADQMLDLYSTAINHKLTQLELGRQRKVEVMESYK